MTSLNDSDLCKRLREETPVDSWSPELGTTPVNRDGPEAAAEIETLSARMGELEAGLDFYADPKTWEWSPQAACTFSGMELTMVGGTLASMTNSGKAIHQPEKWTPPAYRQDRGDKARQARSLCSGGGAVDA